MNVLDKLLFNLRTISNITKGKRINTSKEFIYIDEDTTAQGFWRWTSGDSRERTVQTICKEVRTVIAINNYLCESYYLFAGDDDEKYTSRIADMKKIRAALIGSKQGIDNVCATYEGDPNVIAALRPLIDEMLITVTSITHLLHKLGVIDDLMIY